MPYKGKILFALNICVKKGIMFESLTEMNIVEKGLEEFLRHLQYHAVNQKNCSQFISNSNWSKHNFSVTQVARRSLTFLENISKEIKSRCTYIVQFTYPYIPMLYFYHQILWQFSNLSILVNVGLIKLYFLRLYKILFISIFLFQKS